MKILFTLIVCICGVITKAQNPKNENNIKDLKTLNIYGGNNKIVIGKIIINQTLVTKVFLLSSSQAKDSSGIYTTIFRLGNTENIPLFGVNILLEFSDSVISVDPQLGSGGMTITQTLIENKKFKYTAGQINRPFNGNVLLYFTVRSKNKISTTITGIDGVLN